MELWRYLLRKNSGWRLALCSCLILLCLSCSGCGKEADVPDVTQEAENSLERWRESLPLPEERGYIAQGVRGVEVVRDNQAVFAASYEPKEYKGTYECWDILKPYESSVIVDTEYLYSYFNWLQRLQEEMQPVKVQTDGKQAGLETENGNDNCKNTVYVAYYQGQSVDTPGPAEPDAGILYRIGSPDGQGNYYVGIDGTEEISLVPEQIIDGIYGIEPFESILKVTNLVNIDTVSKIQAEAGGTVLTLGADAQEYRIGERQAEKEEFYEVYARLLGVYIEKEIPDYANGSKPADAGDVVLCLTFERSVEGAPDIIQQYAVYDEQYCTVSVNGKSFFLVDRQEVEALKELLLSYGSQGYTE